MGRNPRSNVHNNSSNIHKSNDVGRRKDEEKSSQEKGIQCYECEGFRHIRTESPTYLKKQKKGLSVTWSEEDSESDLEEESAKYVKALTSICTFDGNSGDD